MAHYTLVQNERGGALDDAYLYRLEEIDPSAEAQYFRVVTWRIQRRTGIGSWIIKRFKGLS
jgi:glycine cleavage system aminomethyltransferase T